MEYEFVTYEAHDNICWITLNRPEKLNALNEGLQRDLFAALDEADADWDVRCIVIKAAGRAFCAGYDVAPSPERAYREDQGTNLQWDINNMRRAGKKWNDLWNISKPVLCQVHGYCLAAGTDIAVHSDIIIVAEDAKIGFPPVRNLGTPATHMWTYLIGPQWTKWAFFTGDNFSGKQAAEMGWALKAVPAEQLEDTVNELAGRIARVSYEMLAASKSICNKAIDLMGRSLLQTLAAETDAISHQSTAVQEFHRMSQEQGLKEALKWMNAPFQDYGKGQQEKTKAE